MAWSAITEHILTRPTTRVMAIQNRKLLLMNSPDTGITTHAT